MEVSGRRLESAATMSPPVRHEIAIDRKAPTPTTPVMYRWRCRCRLRGNWEVHHARVVLTGATHRAIYERPEDEGDQGEGAQ